MTMLYRRIVTLAYVLGPDEGQLLHAVVRWLGQAFFDWELGCAKKEGRGRQGVHRFIESDTDVQLSFGAIRRQLRKQGQRLSIHLLPTGKWLLEFDGTGSDPERQLYDVLLAASRAASASFDVDGYQLHPPRDIELFLPVNADRCLELQNNGYFSKDKAIRRPGNRVFHSEVLSTNFACHDAPIPVEFALIQPIGRRTRTRWVAKAQWRFRLRPSSSVPIHCCAGIPEQLGYWGWWLLASGLSRSACKVGRELGAVPPPPQWNAEVLDFSVKPRPLQGRLIGKNNVILDQLEGGYCIRSSTNYERKKYNA